MANCSIAGIDNVQYSGKIAKLGMKATETCAK
jgi:hypothetical protein